MVLNQNAQTKTWDVSFQVTEQMVDVFARLTGDFSSLHMDKQQARGHAYHQRVVHGMLPVSALLLLEPFHGPAVAAIKKISGRFMYPVYLGDTVTVELTKEPEDKGVVDGQRYVFSIRSSSIREPATYGAVTLSYLPGQNASVPLIEPVEGSFLQGVVKENVLELEQIKKGHTEAVTFDTISGKCTAWLKELRKYVIGQADAVCDHSGLSEMIAVMLCSTLVGMRLPGRRATFLDFSFDFIRPLQSNTSYVLGATVDFVSSATRIAVEKIEISNTGHPEEIQGQGKVSVKIDEPTRPLPDFKELSQYTGDHSLKGKVVIITGASRGIGATTARLFACQGAHVVVNYLASASEAQKVVEDIMAHGARAIAIQADVSDRDQVQAMVAKAVEVFGGVDILVNNAVTDFLVVPFQHLTWGKVQRDIDVIVQGAFHCCQEVIPLMIKKGGGRIINVGTVATEIPPAGHSQYVIAKSALMGLTRSLAVELAGHHILVNMVMPSMVETDLTKTIPPAVRDKIRSSNPLGRHPTTVDVAQAIIALSGPHFDYTTGQKFFITGGLPPFI